MKLFKSILLLGFMLIAKVSYADEPINSTYFGSLAINGYDTVAYWTQSEPVKGKKQHTYEWWGAKWRFSSAENMELFKADPKKYIPEYGGYCAYAMSDGRLVDVDNDAWEIYDGKLYLNYSKSVQKNWREKKEQYIQEANALYPTKVDLPKE